MKSDKISIIVGKRIQSARLSKGLTQEQLAEKCNVSTNHISSIETGNSSFSFPLLISLCNGLDITPNYIFADFFSSSNDSLTLIDKDVLLTYMKLNDESKKFVNSVITQIYKIQTRR